MPRLSLATLALGVSFMHAPLVAGEGVVHGTVAAANAVKLGGATVSAVGAAVSATTDAEGRYRLEHLPAGQSILIVASASGFEPKEQWVLVVQGQPTVVDFQLTL